MNRAAMCAALFIGVCVGIACAAVPDLHYYIDTADGGSSGSSGTSGTSGTTADSGTSGTTSGTTGGTSGTVTLCDPQREPAGGTAVCCGGSRVWCVGTSCTKGQNRCPECATKCNPDAGEICCASGSQLSCTTNTTCP